MNAGSIVSVERKRFSCLAPVFRLRSVAWTYPRQFPGVMCWDSMTRHRAPSIEMHMPLLSSVAFGTSSAPSLGNGGEYSAPRRPAEGELGDGDRMSWGRGCGGGGR